LKEPTVIDSAASQLAMEMHVLLVGLAGTRPLMNKVVALPSLDLDGLQKER
jgi:hypothetical protein